MFNYGCQQELITPSLELKAILEYACGEANKLTNCVIYYCRQLYFKTGVIAGKYDLHKLLKTNPHFQALYSHVSQQALTNRQMRDAVNKAARLVVNNCVDNQIGTIVFGWNKGQRQECTLGRSTQSFVQIPTAKLKDRIAQLCEQYGIHFVETEESYTSKASFVDGDFLPTYSRSEGFANGEQNKPEGWKPSGKRVKRGLYRTANNQYLNCDCQGAANIIKKVSATLGICLKGVSSGALRTPMRVRFWTVHESPALANQSASGLEA